MVLMAFKKQEKAKPRDTMSLALHCFSKRTISKACEMQLKIVESWVKTPSNPKLIDQRALSEKIHFLHTPLESALLSSFPSATQVLLDLGMGASLLSAPRLTKWDLSSIADRWPSCYREGFGSLWIRGPVTVQRQATYPTLWAASDGDSFGQLVRSSPSRQQRAGAQLPSSTLV